MILQKVYRKYGFLLLFFGVLLLVCLSSYNASDTCINVVNSADVTNILGKYGAIISDLMLQSIGLTSYFIAILFIYFGAVILHAGYLRLFFLKTLSSLLMTVVLCFIFGYFSRYNFTFQMLPGGYLGFYLNGLIKNKFILFFLLLINLVLLPIFGYLIVFFNPKRDLKRSALLFSPVMKVTGFTFGLFKIFDLLAKLGLTKARTKIKKIKTDSKKIEPFSEISKVVVLDDYLAPDVELLSRPVVAQKENVDVTDSGMRANMLKLSKVISEFGIRGEMIGFKHGPVVSLYELRLQTGIKSSRVIGLADDIARTMMVSSVRIATITGKDTLGIEMPNKERRTVSFRNLIECNEYRNSEAHIPLILGCDIFGNPIVADLTAMPHLLVAGTTGSGKSVGVNGMILSILFKLSHNKCKFIMIDPKMLEFSLYNDIPHLMHPVITDAKSAVMALKYAVAEMENRYRKMSLVGVRNVYGYNEKILSKQLPDTYEYMPFIVVIIDEMADLMVVAGKEIEILVQRLSQMARAAGIHLIMATQRPSVDVVTGVIKANFPTRISYQVTSKIDSRTILGEQGAEQLLGKGDMLYMASGGKLVRVHGPFVSDKDVESVVNDLKARYEPKYVDIQSSIASFSDDQDDGFDIGGTSEDLYSQAIRIVMQEKKTSISYIQRKLRIGYNKAANLVEQMEQDGILSEADHTGKRMILRKE